MTLGQETMSAAMPEPDALTLQHLSTMDLKQLLHMRGLSTFGDRPALLQRLTARMIKDLPTECVWAAGRGTSQRRGASCVVYKGRIYQFGGIDTNHVDYNTIHMWSPDAAGFVPVRAKGQPPEARWTHSAVVHSDCMYVFGGFYGYAGTAKPTGRLNDLWCFDFATGWWTEVATTGTRPSRRSHHTALVADAQMIVFGGVDEVAVQVDGHSLFESDYSTLYETQHLSDTYILELSTWEWRRVAAAGPRPYGGLRAAAVLWGGFLYTLGWRPAAGAGPAEEGPRASPAAEPSAPPPGALRRELWRLALHAGAAPQWEEVASVGRGPGPRDSFSACRVGSEWVVHGGREAGGAVCSDTFRFHFPSATWEPLQARGVPGVLPDVRYGHKAVALGSSMFVVGGCSKLAARPDMPAQRCAAVEQLMLARPVPPPEDAAAKPLQEAAPPGETATPGRLGVEGRRSMLAPLEHLLRRSPFTTEPVPSPSSSEPSTLSAVSDVALVSAGLRVHCHSSVLVAQSQRFRAVLRASPRAAALEEALGPRALHRLARRRPALLPLATLLGLLHRLFVAAFFSLAALLPAGKVRVVHVSDVRYEVLLVLLQYMYNCLEELDEDLLPDVLRAAHTYGIASLQADCLRHLAAIIDLSNVGQVAQLAEECGSEELYAACLRFAKGSWNEVVRSQSYLLLLKHYPGVGQRLTADVQAAVRGQGADAQVDLRRGSGFGEPADR